MRKVIKSIESNRREPVLLLHSERFIAWCATPFAMAAAAGIDVVLMHQTQPFYSLVLLGPAILLGVAISCWHVTAAYFWVAFHMTVFRQARTYDSEELRRAWFTRVRDWMVLNRLNGSIATHFLFSGAEYRRLAWTFNAVARRAESTASPDCDPERRRIDEAIGEIPQIGLLLFYLCHWRLVVVTRIIFYWLVLAALHWLICLARESSSSEWRIIPPAAIRSVECNLITKSAPPKESQATQPIRVFQADQLAPDMPSDSEASQQGLGTGNSKRTHWRKLSITNREPPAQSAGSTTP